MPYRYKAILVLLFYVVVQSMATEKPYKGLYRLSHTILMDFLISLGREKWKTIMNKFIIFNNIIF